MNYQKLSEACDNLCQAAITLYKYTNGFEEKDIPNGSYQFWQNINATAFMVAIGEPIEASHLQNIRDLLGKAKQTYLKDDLKTEMDNLTQAVNGMLRDMGVTVTGAGEEERAVSTKDKGRK